MNDRKILPAWVKAAIAVALLVVFAFTVMLAFEVWAKHKIHAAIEKEAIEVAGTPVKIRVGRVYVSLAARTVIIRNIRLTAQNNVPSNNDARLVSIDGGIEAIILRGIWYRKTEDKLALSARELLIYRPHGTLVTRASKKHSSRNGQQDFRQAVKEHFDSVTIENIEVRNAAMEYVRWGSDDESRRTELKGGELSAEDFRIDSLSEDDRILFCKDIGLDVAELSYGYAAGAMVARVDTLSMRSKGTLSAAAVRLVPQFSKDEFAQKSKEHKDWMRVDVIELNCVGVDFRRLITGEIVRADSIWINSADIASYKNKQVDQQPTVKPTLWQNLQSLPIPVDIRKVGFRDIAVEYDELSETSTSPGVVHFTQCRGEMLNITNIAEGHDPYFTVNVTAELMNSAAVSATCDFPVSPSNDHFRVKGTVGPTAMSSFNSALTPLMNIRIDSGEMTSLDFELNGSTTKSHITLTMLYDGLSVSLLEAHDHSRERGFLTFVADDILIKNANPVAGKQVRTATGNYTRDPHHSMYSYIWKSFVPALIKTVL
jgi:hypothetical protein